MSAPKKPVIVDLEHAPVERKAEQLERTAAGWQPPLLPGAHEDLIKRFKVSVGFSPPGSVLLNRYVNPATGRYEHSLTGSPGPEWVHDRAVGLVQQFAVPGTLRLAVADDRFQMTEDEGDLGPGRRHLGFIEQAPFVLMDPLEIRVLPETGQDILCAGELDPIRHVTEHVTNIGWVEAFPVNPQPHDRTAEWTFAPLHRIVDVPGWRHRYVVTHEPPSGAVLLGWLHRRASADLVPLEQGPGGRLSTPLLPAPAAQASPVEFAKWAVAPLRWGRDIGESRVDMTRSRMRTAPLVARRRLSGAGGAIEVLGRLARDGGVPLFSATHPATGDQLVTRSDLEARDLGYVLDGVLGHVVADRPQPPAATGDVPWGSRLGRGRRTHEGSVVPAAG